MKATNAEAQSFKALHVPGKPLLLANVHDAASADLFASLPGCSAIATASYSVALANGVQDPDLTLETQLRAVAGIAAAVRARGKPLTVDPQDGYGEELEAAVRGMIELGAVGINLEDSDRKTGAVLGEEEAVGRVRRALQVAADVGLPDFVVNARASSFLKEGDLDESLRRAGLCLAAGATTALIFPHGMRDLSCDEVEKVVAALGGRVNLWLRLQRPGEQAEGVLTCKDLAELGVARVSIGLQLFLAAVEAMRPPRREYLPCELGGRELKSNKLD